MSKCKLNRKPHASQKVACKMIKEAMKDEKKGNKFYQRLASKLTERHRKRVVSEIAQAERGHKGRLAKLKKDLMC